MAWNLVKTLTIIMGILVSIHVFLYFSFLKLYNLSDYKKILLASLICLTLSFPFMILIDRLVHNIVTQILSAISGIWMTTGFYLIIIFIVLWIIYGFYFLAGKSIQDSAIFIWFSRGLLFSMLVFTIYGVFLAWKIQITPVNVVIKNLPRYWEGKKILQLSDVHIGAIWGNGRLKKLAEIIKKTQPDLVVITGDLFDGASGRHERFLPGLQYLAKTNPPEGIFYTSGNHERYAGYDKIIPVIEKSGITLLENRLVNLHDLQLVGIQYPDFTRPGQSGNVDKKEYDFQDDPEYKKNKPVILLYHVPVEYSHSPGNMSEMQQEAYMKPNTDFITARKKNVDLQLSGHTHAGQFFPFAPITKKIFHGFHYGLHRVDNFQIYIHAGTGTWGPPVRHGLLGEVALITLKRG